jgi:cation diffusion facilitator CzcD-associated flavoprotein CzcO
MPSASRHVHVAIVGSGFSGLGTAIRLKQAGFHDFAVLERANEVGGCWRDNTYPGCACDVESPLYSFSFAPNPGWSRSFSPQAEILDYLRRTARDHGVLPHVRFGHELLNASWDERRAQWRIETSAGPLTASVLVGGMGPLTEPAIPALPGLESFRGEAFHSARWRHDVSLSGKRVAVVGTGASAVQFLPRIQPTVAQLTLFQRTPAWVIPRIDKAISPRMRRIYRALPITQRLTRAAIYARREAYIFGFRNPAVMKALERFARRYLEQQVPDPVLRRKLTPDFRMGCKRILLTNDYLRTLGRSNVEVVTDGIRELRPHAIVSADGREHPVDVILFGTGFQVTDIPFAKRIFGRAGKSLHETWQGSPTAHLGTTVSGFPNLFLLLGPNTGLGHTSVVLMIESQLQIVIEALQHMRAKHLTSCEPRPEVQAAFVRELVKQSRDTVWTSGGCVSWYIDKTGRNSAVWPSFTFAFRRRAHFRPEEYLLGRGEVAAPVFPHDFRFQKGSRA